MAPAVMMAASGAKKVMDNPAAMNVLNTGMKALAVGAGLWLFLRFMQGVGRDSAAAEFSSDTKRGRAVGFATTMYNAMHTRELISSWIGDGTDEELLYKTAVAIFKDKDVSFQDVAGAYKDLFDRTLLLDLKDELNASEMAKFQSYLTNGKLNGISGLLVQPGIIYTTVATRLYDDQMKPVGSIEAKLRLGEQIKTYTDQQGLVYRGFFYGGFLLFVPAIHSLLANR